MIIIKKVVGSCSELSRTLITQVEIMIRLKRLFKIQLITLAIRIGFFTSLILGLSSLVDAQTGAGRPNIILINLDDADVDIFADKMLDRYLPSIKELAGNSLKFTNCHVTTPLCGPSRVCLMLGQHAHRTGIRTNLATGKMNNGFAGSYDLFKAKGYEQENLAVWMQRAGYRTMIVGKYMHGKMDPVGIPGWDDLFITFGGNYYKTSRYASRLPRDYRRRATKEGEYRTVVEADEAVGMIEKHAASEKGKASNKKEQPFYLYIAPLAPHLPARKTKMLQEEYKDIGKEIRVPKTPDFNEADVSDKPLHLQAPKLTDEQISQIHEEYRRRVACTKSVDDMVSKLFNVLDQTGLRENTYIFFTSDHGYQLGHNRMLAKKLSYHRTTNVPLFVVGPGVSKGTSDHLLGHIDLTATFLDIAGGKSTLGLEGKSVLPILNDPKSVGHDDFRKSLLIQNWEEKGQLGTLIHARYATVRTRKEIFTQWSNGADEYYDLSEDPYQLENKITSLSDEQRLGFESQLRELKQGMDKPVVTISNPGLVSRSPVLIGVAEDDELVKETSVQVEDPASGLFWDGKGWSKENTFLNAKMANTGGLISDWHCPVDLSKIEHDGKVIVRSKTRGDADWSETIEQTFSVDAIEPKTELVLPRQASVVASPVLIRGQCSDNLAMTGVELTLHRLEDGTYWNGEKWSREKSTFFKRVVLQDWHIKVPSPAGKYKVSVRAMDQAGNFDPAPKTSEFSVK